MVTRPTMTDLRAEADLSARLDLAREALEAAEHDLAAFVPREQLEADVARRRGEVARLDAEHAAAARRIEAKPRRTFRGGGL